MYNWICVSTFLNWVRAALHFSGATFDSLVAMAAACPPTACLSNNPIWSSHSSFNFHISEISQTAKKCCKADQLYPLI